MTTVPWGATRISDAGLIHLKGLKNCMQVLATGTGVTPAGAASMKASLPMMQIIP